MKYTFVGDIHGQVEIIQKALQREGKIIFVGDLQDSFTRSHQDHSTCFELVLDAIEKGKAECVYGNHELSYLRPKHRCSGYNYHRHKVIDSHKERINALFKPYLFLGDSFLVSHAGFTKDLWDNEDVTLENIQEKFAAWWPRIESPLHWIGQARGGPNYYGGIFWCDFEREFKPIPELIQVFGHSHGKGIRQKENAYCIDCLEPGDHSFLEMEIDDVEPCFINPPLLSM